MLLTFRRILRKYSYLHKVFPVIFSTTLLKLTPGMRANKVLVKDLADKLINATLGILLKKSRLLINNTHLLHQKNSIHFAGYPTPELIIKLYCFSFNFNLKTLVNDRSGVFLFQLSQGYVVCGN